LFPDFGEENENKVSGEDEMSDNDSDFDIEHADIALDICCSLSYGNDFFYSVFLSLP